MTATTNISINRETFDKVGLRMTDDTAGEIEMALYDEACVKARVEMCLGTCMIQIDTKDLMDAVKTLNGLGLV